MRKHVFVLFISFAFIQLTGAQQSQLMIKGSGKDLHLDHTVSPKEGLFSIGRMYHVHPKAIAAYNKLEMTKGLSVGQVIHIPLTDTNFSQKDDNGKPIFYNVGEKETLEKVSAANNKVSVQKLRAWNKLAHDDQAAGKKLIIGFLVTNESPIAATPTSEKKETVVKDTIATELTANPKTEQDKPGIKEEDKKDNEKKADKSKVAKAKNADAKDPNGKENVVPEKPIIKEELKKAESKKAETNSTRLQVIGDVTGQGYFKSSFDQQVKITPLSKVETVTSGIFRMTNGPREGKYYMLMDGVPSGTIIKIINPDNNKTIYAKVLGEMSGIRQNQGLNIRISNAAASTLDINDTDKFIVKINY